MYFHAPMPLIFQLAFFSSRSFHQLCLLLSVEYGSIGISRLFWIRRIEKIKVDKLLN